MKRITYFLLLSLITMLLYDCARKGRPTGGPKDESAPILVTANPPNETVNFNKKKIKIYFDEYIVLKDLNKQLVVSPPMKNPPLITPQGLPSKYINIEILDTLKTNTTYTFNFGNAVQDNNENNKLEAFKYVFSTGTYIDSLTTKGNVKDAFSKDLAKDISVLLYKLDTSYGDSTIFKKKPFYVTSTLDSSNYEFSNLRKGNYLLVALKQNNKDYIFNPKTDKIAFALDTISLPKDSIIEKELSLFKEIQAYKFRRGKEVSKGKIQFGFEGKQTNLKVKILSDLPDTYKSFSQFEKDKDTLNYWFTPIERDSLMFLISNNKNVDTSKVFLRKKKIDSLKVTASTTSLLQLNDTLFFNTNNPIVKIDTTKFSLIDKDTLDVKFSVQKQDINRFAILFEKKQRETYKLNVLPEAFTDIFETTNDTIKSVLRTKALDDYGSIILEIKKEVKAPLILELLSKNNKVIATKYIKESKEVEFNLLNPNTYKVRVILDANENNKWDTGNFLKKIQPERVIWYENELKVRANWVVNETFTIK